MKRTVIVLSLIFALAIALSASIPTLAASGTTTVTGSLATKLEITAPTGFALTLDPDASPATGSSGTPGNIKSNKAWTLVTTDLTNGGYMKSVAAPATALGSKFQINVNGGGLRDASTTTPTVTGSKGATNPITFAASQAVSYSDDPATDYQIVITFTVSN